MAPSMDPSTLNAMLHVIIDDENPMTGNDVATDNHVQTSDDTFSPLKTFNILLTWITKKKKLLLLFKFNELG